MPSPSARPPTAAIFGCAGPALAPDERRLFAAVRPLGFILFERNCADPDQVRALVGDLRGAVGRADAPVLIDQEGGRVARLKPPHWRAVPAAGRFGALALHDVDAACQAVRLNARLIAAELGDLGIDVDCAPVLDVPVPGAHDVIGDRAYATDPEVVAMLGRAACDGLAAGGVRAMVKHIPGHGRARADSHHELPRVEASLELLRTADFVPFRRLADAPFAMTAHVVFAAVDEAPATTSARVIADIVRGEIGFDGVLVSDDLSMRALRGGLADRARAALDAGCDAVLHCNGKRDEMAAVADAAGPVSEAAQERLAAAGAGRRTPEPIDRAALAARLDGLLAEVAG